MKGQPSGRLPGGEKRAGKAKPFDAIQETDRVTEEAGLQVEGPSALDTTGSHTQDPKASRKKEMRAMKTCSVGSPAVWTHEIEVLTGDQMVSILTEMASPPSRLDQTYSGNWGRD